VLCWQDILLYILSDLFIPWVDAPTANIPPLSHGHTPTHHPPSSPPTHPIHTTHPSHMHAPHPPTHPIHTTHPSHMQAPHPPTHPIHTTHPPWPGCCPQHHSPGP
jgi:hypothetical protein